MKACYRHQEFRRDSLRLLGEVAAVLDSSEGLQFTVRQMYYQLVVRGAVPNTPAAYGQVQRLICNARMAGLLDWDAFEDRLRLPHSPSEFSGLPELLEVAARSYRLPRLAGQRVHPELWVEKDALAGVLLPVASRYHTTLQVCRGYSSASSLHESYARLKSAEGLPCVLYMGDHDPSGLDMPRDIRDRFDEFGGGVEVKPIALTMGQIHERDLPPNPAKVTDKRAAAYIAEFGPESWELDALPPDDLSEIAERAILELLDVEKMNAVIAREEQDRGRLGELMGDLAR